MWLGLPAAAQQAIQFTKPVDADPASKANAFLPDNPSHLSVGAFNAPSPLFGAKGPTANFDVLPGSPPPEMNPNPYAAQWRKSMDQKKNWTLLTPQEIWGIQTPEQAFGVIDPADDPKISAAERYLRRQDRQAGINASNSVRQAESMLWRADNNSDNPDQTTDGRARISSVLMGPVSGLNRNASPFFNGSPDGRQEVNQKPASAWTSPFDSPPPLPKPTPEQLAGMDRFHAIMDGPPPEKTPSAGGLGSRLAPAPDPNMQVMPFFNPAGQGVAPLSSGLIRPTGLTPLAGVSGPLPQPAKAAPLVQPPPWTQNSQQGGSLPQRQF
jgi:hypothetical protein